jgi:hypothetical protein
MNDSRLSFRIDNLHGFGWQDFLRQLVVVGFLDSLGFDPTLIASLAKAESLYRASSDAFDLKKLSRAYPYFYERSSD